MINIFYKHKRIILLILIISIIGLIFLINIEKTVDYEGTFVKVGDIIGNIYKAL